MVRFLLITLLFLVLPSAIVKIEKRSQSGTVQSEELLRFSGSLFGPSTLIFDPAMNMHDIQAVIDSIHSRQTSRQAEFTKARYALLFKPGTYRLDLKIGYYTQVAGLGDSPEDVVIEGNIKSLTTRHGNVLTNFWRAVENLTVVPERDSAVIWGVSQAAPMRRVHIKGNLNLFDKGYASGGFLADSKVDGVISSGPQQQWFTRNSETGGWKGGVWNMMFMGVIGAPASDFPQNPYTTLGSVPVIREKPYLVYVRNKYFVTIPAIRRNASGTDRTVAEKIIPLKKFYIASPSMDNAGTINSALRKGKHILLTPGRYILDESLKIDRDGTVVMGTGFATLVPVKGNAAIEVAGAGGVILCGITIDAGRIKSDRLLVTEAGAGGKQRHPGISFLYDIFFRVGGPDEGSAKSCMVINSDNVVIDHTWIWRADHGNGVGWERNRCANGLVVNGNNVTVYGLFNEHFQEYQTLWNGENGKVFFYQSEMPYDPPSADAWGHDGINGYASYKVSDNVKSHQAWGLGIYNVFYDAPVIVDNAIETPAHLEDSIRHKVIFWLNGNRESVVRSIINGKGGQVDVNNRKAAMK